MKIGDYCKRATVSVAADMDLVDAAKLMRDEHVGFLIAYAQGDDIRKPVGVLTDRDIVLQVIAKEVEPHSVSVQDVMTRQPLIARESDDLSEALQAMRLAGIRRVPVVNTRGGLSGIFAMDDAIDVIAGMMCDLTGSIKSEQRQEWKARSA